MAIPLIPVAGLALGALASLSLLAIQNALQDRTFGNDPILPPPNPQIPPYTPPFTGGQCVGETYYTAYRVRQFQGGNLINTSFRTFPQTEMVRGAVRGISSASIDNGDPVNGAKLVDTAPDGSERVRFAGFGFSNAPNVDVVVDQIELQYQGVGTDNCGNLPNPNPPIPPFVGGGNLLPVPNENPEVYHAGAIVPVLSGILAALAAIASAIGTIGNVLDGIRAIGDAIGKIREWLEEKEKEKPKNRTIWAGRWSSMEIEGGTDLITQLIDGQVLSPYQVQIEIERFPVTCSRKLGINSPSFAHLEPLGYLFPRSANGGYSEVIPIRFLRNSASINEDTRGLSWSFRENPLVKARFRVWYSSAPTSI